MAIDELLESVEQYLGDERELREATADSPRRSQLKRALAVASRTLGAQLQDYAEQRSRAGAIRSIVVAVDLSEPAHWALDEAIRLAHQLGARVSVLHVIDAAPVLAQELALDAAFSQPAVVQAGGDVLSALADRVPRELLGKQVLREGPADKEIVLACQELCADLLVIGTHGRGLLGRFLLGSVAEAVVRHATCPVLTVGQPRRGAAPEPYAVELAEPIAAETASRSS